jgi:predicted alpha/beta hydrolase
MSDSLIIETHDGFPISANLFRPLNGQDIKALLVIANATGVQARFYHDFAG